MSAKHIIAVYALGENDAKFLGVILELANRHLPVPWEVGTAAEASVILVDVDKPEGMQFWNTYQGRALPVALSWYDKYKKNRYLEKPLSTALRSLGDLLDILHKELSVMDGAVESAPRQTPPSAEKSPPPLQQTPLAATSTSTLRFDPAVYLLGCVRQILREERAMIVRSRVEGSMLPALYVLPAQKRWCASSAKKHQVWKHEDLQALCREENLQCTPLTVAEQKVLITERRFRPEPLPKLLWLSALHGSQGRLPAHLEYDTPVRLKHWPNFTGLSYHPDYMTLSAYMLSNTENLKHIAEQTGISLQTVIDFYNACETLGIGTSAETVRRRKPQTLSEEKQNLFGRLLRRLFS